MKRLLYITVIIFTIMSSAWAREDCPAIFNFVRQEMSTMFPEYRSMELDYPADPKVYYVSEFAMRQIFIFLNRHSFEPWVAKHGQRASNMLKYIANRVVGMIDQFTGDIYVGNWLDAHRKKEILAHEYTHYVQWLSKGHPAIGDIDIRAKREDEADYVENRVKQFLWLRPVANVYPPVEGHAIR